MIASSSSFNNPLRKRWIILASLGINKCHKPCQELSFVDITAKNAMLYGAFTCLKGKILHMINACVIPSPTATNSTMVRGTCSMDPFIFE